MNDGKIIHPPSWVNLPTQYTGYINITTMSAAEPSTRLAATVADESEEIMAESSGTAVAVPASSSAPAPPATADTDATPTEADGDKPEETEEAKVDPNALPEDACVTLYLQNLNEKVRLPGESRLAVQS